MRRWYWPVCSGGLSQPHVFFSRDLCRPHVSFLSNSLFSSRPPHVLFLSTSRFLLLTLRFILLDFTHSYCQPHVFFLSTSLFFFSRGICRPYVFFWEFSRLTFSTYICPFFSLFFVWIRNFKNCKLIALKFRKNVGLMLCLYVTKIVCISTMIRKVMASLKDMLKCSRIWRHGLIPLVIGNDWEISLFYFLCDCPWGS